MRRFRRIRKIRRRVLLRVGSRAAGARGRVEAVDRIRVAAGATTVRSRGGQILEIRIPVGRRYSQFVRIRVEGTIVLSLEDRGILLETKKGSQLWSWEEFSGFKETIYFFHVYFSARSFFMIPKDSFKDITEIQAARKLLKERIKS